ncbi:MAG: 2-isopropylmalate synthase [Proteobacteria bacterium]|nr:2-isopropylmalate synthase [Pseudomonadota bacterium]MBI3498229.1 2-isopropylmalate synthase [Pseudomonadota bacterium]
MTAMPVHKYRAFPPINLPDRSWPSRSIEAAPIWCSVDLRDGNQALVEPMGPERKRRMFQLLLDTGFKEIEVGFPSASETDFAFVRALIEENLVPADVTIQVLTQARPELIRRTFEAIKGARRAIVHLYNSTSTLQRRVVFGLDRPGIVAIAVNGATLIRRLADAVPETDIVLQYSPESFTGTELDFAKEIVERVAAIWQPTPAAKMIVNLPATVEMATPNVFADQIEWFHRTVAGRERVVLSVHPHNDRGTAVAAAELAVMAGAERIEGTLFGNGERTGNVDLVTLALNLVTQGVDPGLDFSDIQKAVETAQHCNRLPLHPRHPYAGELVFTAFSGSHQDAIKKGFAAMEGSNSGLWEVPYLPIDPKDVGRSYEAVIRVNSQSGKGGVAYVLLADYGIDLPRRLQIEFAHLIQRLADSTEKEIASAAIWTEFEREYLKPGRTVYLGHETWPSPERPGQVRIEARIRLAGAERKVAGSGNGPIAAFVEALRQASGQALALVDYREHAVTGGADATAVAFVEMTVGSRTLFGVGMDANIVTASLQAVASAVGREQAVSV